MYQLVNQAQGDKEVGGLGAAAVTSSELEPLESRGSGIVLHTEPNCTNKEETSVDGRLRIVAVSAVVDMQLDALPVVPNTVPGAAWTSNIESSLDTLLHTIEITGKGYIENPRAEWVKIGATAYSQAYVDGYTASEHCTEQSGNDADGCSCSVMMPQLFSDTRNTTSLFQTSTVPTLSLDVSLRPCTPVEVVQAMQEVVSTWLPLRMAVCVRLLASHMTGNLHGCHVPHQQPPPNPEVSGTQFDADCH